MYSIPIYDSRVDDGGGDDDDVTCPEVYVGFF